MIQVQVQHSFYQKHSLYQNVSPPLLAAHAFNDSGYQGSSAPLPDLSPVGSPCFQWFRLTGSSATLPDLSPVGSPCFQVQEQLATSQHHAKHQANSPATLPIYCFQSKIPNRGRVTQHAIQPNIASKPANAPRRRAVKETRPHNTPKNLDTVFCEPYPTTLSINDAEI